MSLWERSVSFQILSPLLPNWHFVMRVTKRHPHWEKTRKILQGRSAPALHAIPAHDSRLARCLCREAASESSLTFAAGRGQAALKRNAA